jgi:uncharacterized protein YciI
MLIAPICTDKPTLADRDPYAHAGLFAPVEIRPWNRTLGNPEAA